MRPTGLGGAQRVFALFTGCNSLAQIGVFYLCRFAEGGRPVRRFVDSYRAHPAGLEHDLHVIFKGFPSTTSLSAAQALFADLSLHSIELEDKGYDIGSYFAAAAVVTNPRLIFFNSFAELLGDDWLKKFDDALNLPGVGLVGATGSWQSPRSLYVARVKRGVNWVKHPLDYLNYLGRVRAEPLGSDGDRAPPRGGGAGDAMPLRMRQMLRRLSGSLYDLLRFDHYFHYIAYPNPHVRTNAFMIERDRFLALRASSFRTKFGVYKFESGRQSLTQQVLKQGLRPVVVDRDGRIYDVADWKSSSTYWIDQQDNLIAADNRTRDYSEGSPQLRARLQAHAWEHPSSWSGNAGFRPGDERPPPQ
jgi:hypothetical protein